MSAALLIALVFGLSMPAVQDQTDHADATNPVARDPVIIEAGGTYYMFHTGRGIAVRTSDDLQTWSERSRVFDETPAWVKEKIPDFHGGMWAPDIYEKDGTYYLYYSVSEMGKNNSAIGVATATSLDSSSDDFGWTDHGPVIESVPTRDFWNAIDPHVIEAGGEHWMSFGSYWSGIKLVKLAENLTELAEPQQWHAIAARHRSWAMDPRTAGGAAELDPTRAEGERWVNDRRTKQESAIEAPNIFQRGDWFYLFVSWDRCAAGLDSTYKVVVGRSKRIEGPYLDETGQDLLWGGGTLVTRGLDNSTRWVAAGHSDVYSEDGTDYLTLHGYDKLDDGRNRFIIKPITWDDLGWPSVEMSE